MKRKILMFSLLVAIVSGTANSQDNILDELLDEGAEITTSTFKASRIINGHSIEQPGAGEMEFRISHRFGKINGGLYELFGLDQATIHFSLEYSPFRWLTVGYGRSNYKKTYDGSLKANILQQQSGIRNIPVTVSYFTSFEASILKSEIENFEWYHRFNYTHQLLVARKISKRISLQLTPTFVHKNLVTAPGAKNDFLALGAGGRLKITNRLSVNAEAFILEHGPLPENEVYYLPIAVGIDLETGGHVFQIMATNALPMREAGFITETTGDIANGDIHLGFNISRMFNIHK